MSIRCIKLSNPVGNGWVVRIHIGWQGYDEVYKDGTLTRIKNNQHGTWKSTQYADICIGAERTVDLKEDTDIPDKAEVWLIRSIVAGKDGPDSEHYIYDKTARDIVKYRISGALCGGKTLTKL